MDDNRGGVNILRRVPVQISFALGGTSVAMALVSAGGFGALCHAFIKFITGGEMRI